MTLSLLLAAVLAAAPLVRTQQGTVVSPPPPSLSLLLPYVDATSATTVMATPVPYTGDEFVHPDVYDAGSGGAWNGYRYWMVVTPYEGSSSAVENPSIYASANGQAWVTPPGVTNPIIAKPAGYNSDPDITKGLDGKLWLFYREENAAGTVTGIRVTSSDDGATWVSPEYLFTTLVSAGTDVSPGVIFDGTQWVMYTVKAGTGANTINRRTAANPSGPWSAASTVTITTAPTGQEYWHLDALRYKGQTVLLLNTQDTDTTANGKLYLAWSAVGDNFTRGDSPILRVGGWWAERPYRATFAPITSTQFAIWYSASTTAEGWKLGYTTAQRLVSTAWDGARSCTSGLTIACDNFTRADDPTGLGTTSTGQAWAAISGTLGISGNAAYAPAATNNKSTITTAASDVRVGARLDTLGAEQWIVFRLSDTNNFFRVGANVSNTRYDIQKIQAGGATVLNAGSGLGTPAAGDWIEVVAQGSTISVYVNASLRWSGTNTFNQTAVKHGIQTSSTVARYTGFYVATP